MITTLKLSWKMSGGITTEDVSVDGDVFLDRNAQMITFKIRSDNPNVDVFRHVPIRSLWEWQVTHR
ncbi:MAG: hypothetical protein A2Y75_05340 [Candidatus Solincola sediminis]|uniref:Uncharacterized protein n=1 Tax=Candidatus Solincola sediminis TaxID=1797199 RepID=A0A1F2WG61_9ACTN|nr:MAG: hypothetical protein A2Y75_05340 [Candidatus Solincola sediminis]